MVCEYKIIKITLENIDLDLVIPYTTESTTCNKSLNFIDIFVKFANEISTIHRTVTANFL